MNPKLAAPQREEQMGIQMSRQPAGHLRLGVRRAVPERPLASSAGAGNALGGGVGATSASRTDAGTKGD